MDKQTEAVMSAKAALNMMMGFAAMGEMAPIANDPVSAENLTWALRNDADRIERGEELSADDLRLLGVGFAHLHQMVCDGVILPTVGEDIRRDAAAVIRDAGIACGGAAGWVH